MQFEFATATRIVFGAGTSAGLASFAAELLPDDGRRRALFVAGRGIAHTDALLDQLERRGIEPVRFDVDGEPTLDTVERGAKLARDRACGLVIGLGGGSAMDTGKAVAAMATNPGELLDFLEVIGANRPLSRPPLPYIAVPTTAGTGAEVTRNAVLASPEHRVKVSLRSPLMLPRLAVVDPRLTHELPPNVTASTGMDALTQLIEPLVSARANPMTDALCREGIGRAARSLLPAFRDGCNGTAREDMSLASLFGGLALANAGLGAVHGLAGPIGGMFPAPHGAVCAALLPHVMEINVRALRNRGPDMAISRYAEVAVLLTGDPAATADRGIEWVRKLCEEVAIPRLGAYGVRTEDHGRIVEMARVASSMKANPVLLTPEELHEILARAT